MNLTINELNEVLYCLRQTLSSKPELLRTDVAQSALTKVYNELEHQVALDNLNELNQMMNDEAEDEGPEYDSAGFTEDDRIVNGQYMNVETVSDLAGYTDARMNLNEVCEWLNKRGMTATAEQMKSAFTYHTWTKDGMLRTDVIKDCFRAISADGQLFRELECDVITALSFTPLHEAHID